MYFLNYHINDQTIKTQLRMPRHPLIDYSKCNRIMCSEENDSKYKYWKSYEIWRYDVFIIILIVYYLENNRRIDWTEVFSHDETMCSI